MSVKANVGLSKKIGQPDYGSLGATCNVEFELDSGFDNGSSTRFQDAVRRAYVACRQAVEAEIQSHQDGNANNGHANSVPNNRVFGDNSNSQSNGNRNGKAATASQVRAIHAIAKRVHVDLELVLAEFGVSKAEDLSIRDASSLIDQLKSNGANNSVRR